MVLPEQMLLHRADCPPTSLKESASRSSKSLVVFAFCPRKLDAWRNRLRDTATSAKLKLKIERRVSVQSVERHARMGSRRQPVFCKDEDRF
jgi:hypothetical protein